MEQESSTQQHLRKPKLHKVIDVMHEHVILVIFAGALAGPLYG